jgi:4-hydroxy-4-methyl-2-oxoglutarate aldolase
LNETVVRGFTRPAVDTLRKFRELDVSTVYEANGRRGLMDSRIRSVQHDVKLLGPALTVILPAGDNLMEHRALTFAKPGDVLVVTMRGGASGATWGGLFTTQAITMGLGGIVTEGTIRDVSFIRQVKFPCFSAGISSEGTTKMGPGSINVPISCGGLIVNPGDIILGDDDGAMVIPREEGEVAAKRAQERMAKEEEIVKLLKTGKTTYELLGLHENYRKLGITETDS